MRKSLSILTIILSLIFFFTQCSSDDGAPPTNVTLTAEVLQAGSGKVSISVTAENATSFVFDLGDGESVTSSTGSLSYEYPSSGNYTITVEVFGTDGSTLTRSTSVTININTTTLPIPNQGKTSPESYAGMTLVWRDEFSSANISADNWNFETGTGDNGWGNFELQHYTENNAWQQDGYLVIEAREENLEGSSYTSSRITTQNKRSFKFGRIDIRAALPRGQGLWPALWMLGSNFPTVGWPKCGEIDIMEMVGGQNRESTVLGTAHWDNAGSTASFGGDYSLPSGFLGDQFHVFSIVWDSNAITWYIDDISYHVIDITPTELSEFQEEFFFIFNIAVGGTLPGSPDATTSFPQKMIVDYVRVFQEN